MISFFVPGIPAPGGSKKSIYNKKLDRVLTFDDCKRNKPWRDSVASAGMEAMGQREPMTGALEVLFTFYFPRPKGHYGSGKNADKIKASAPARPTVKPDVTKIIRSTEDALTGIVWRDDAQIVTQTAEKFYGTRPGVRVSVRELAAVVDAQDENEIILGGGASGQQAA